MKVWGRSKTLWLNFIALVSALLQSKYGMVLDPTIQGALLASVNLVFRAVTKEGIGLQAE